MQSLKSLFCEHPEADLIEPWLAGIATEAQPYAEPLLSIAATKLIKEVCDIFEQNTHVFILTVDIVEAYVRAKQASAGAPPNCLLAAVTAAFVAHKSDGAQESLKVQHVLDVLFYFSEGEYAGRQVLAMEADVLATLAYRLPISTVVDDLDVLVARHVKEMRLAVSVRPLCLKLLELVYIERAGWFYQMKAEYTEASRGGQCVFENLMSCKCFLPVCIVICAFELTQYRFILDVETIMYDMSEYAMIHIDHLSLMSKKIMELLG